MKIYRAEAQIYNIQPDDSSTQRTVHMGEDVLNLTFRATSPLDLRVGDFVFYDDKKYRLKKPVSPKKESRHEFEYICQFCAPQYDLEDALYILSDATGVGELDDTIPLFGTLTFHAEQILRCIHEVDPEWELGEVEDFGVSKNIVFNGLDCLEAVQLVAGEFGCEYWFDGYTLNFGKRSEGDPLPFKYGKGNSLYDLSRQNQDGRILTKLLVQGSNRNIDISEYGSACLRLPGGEKYVEQNIEKYGTIMGRQKFTDIYPRLIHKEESDPGSVTEVRFAAGIYYIKDENLNFNPADYMLPGLSIKVVFQTGQLGGMKIEANWHNDTQEFELIKGDYGLGIDVPASVFIPAAGDLYILEDIKMPESYVTDAENELLAAAREAIGQLCEQKVSYKGTVNPLYFKYLDEKIYTGRAVTVEDPDLIGEEIIPLRIQAFTRSINDKYNIDIELSDTMYIGRLDKIETSIKEIKDTVETTKVKNGAPGAAIVYRGIFDKITEEDRIFYNNRNRRDVVKYDDLYYIYRGADGAPNPAWIENNWNKFGDQFEAIATLLLLAENANIAGWIFHDGRLESQEGGAFLDGRTGDVYVVGRFESNANGNRIVIDPDNRDMRFLSGNKYTARIGFFEGQNLIRSFFDLFQYESETTTFNLHLRPNGVFFDDMRNGGLAQVTAVRIDQDGKLLISGNFPTSTVGLPIGTIYRDGNVIKVI
jgi:hypothetical protein